MARYTGPHTVQCYHCRHRFEVGGRAQSTSCPKCYKPLFVADITVDSLKAVTEVRTCGAITITRKGRIIAKLVEAHAGIDCDGAIDAKAVVCGATGRLSPRRGGKGDLKSRALVIEPGARITSGFCDVPNDDLKLSTLPPPGAPP